MSDQTLALYGGQPAMTESIPRTLHGVTEIGEPEINAVVEVLKRKTIFRFLNDENTSESCQLEKIYRDFCGVKYALALSGGTGALVCALTGLGIGAGDEVIVPGYTYIASAASCLSVGAIPIIAEIDDSLTIDPADVEMKITPYTKAIMPVHMRGTCCDMDAIMAIAQKHNLKVIEDVAQANGGIYKGRKLGSIGHAGAFSMQHYKVITAGEGGMITTDDEQVYRRAAVRHDSAMQFWKEDEQWESFAGSNFRICEMQAALGLEQFKRMDGILKRCRQIKHTLHDSLDQLEKIQLQKRNCPDGDCGLMFAFFLDTPEKAKRFSEALDAEGLANGTIHNKAFADRHIYKYWDYVIEKKTYDPSGWPWTAAHRPIEYQPDMLPNTLDLLNRCISFGICQHWTDSLLQQVIATITKVHHGLTERGEI